MTTAKIPVPVRVLSADPAWSFSDSLPGEGRGSKKHYDVQTVEDIIRFPLPTLDKNCILFLWRVSSQVEEAYQVMRAWGFKPKTEIVWVKTPKNGGETHLDEGMTTELHMGMGHTTRGAHETCIVGTRGKVHVADRGVRSVFFAPVGEHSVKPDAFFSLVERLFPVDLEQPHHVELFARKPRRGWLSYGNELTVHAPAGVRMEAFAEKLHAAYQRLAPTFGEPKPWNKKWEELTEQGKMLMAAALEDACRPPIFAMPTYTPDPEVKPSETIAATVAVLATAAPASESIVQRILTESLSELVIGLAKRGVAMTLIQASALNPTKRDVAHLFAEQGGDVPEFLQPFVDHDNASMSLGEVDALERNEALKQTNSDAPVGANAGCLACDRGEAYLPGKEYTHTGEGPMCKAQAPVSVTPAPEPEEERPSITDDETKERLVKLAVKQGLLDEKKVKKFGMVEAWLTLLSAATPEWFKANQTKRGRKAKVLTPDAPPVATNGTNGTHPTTSSENVTYPDLWDIAEARAKDELSKNAE